MTADTITAIKKAFPNMFRPLEWHHFDGKTEHGNGEWWAHGSRGMFHIYDVREKFPDDRPFYAKELSDQLDTLEMAQEAVQKRHEMDIVMCLDPGFLSTLESLQRENEELRTAAKGAEPELTCPHIDKLVQSGELSVEAIQELERIRDINSMLRYGLWHEKARAEEAETKAVGFEAELALSKPVYSRRQIEARVKSLEEALKPFTTVSENWVDEEGWSDRACQHDRIVDWFGPSDFRRARTALSSTGDTHGN